MTTRAAAVTEGEAPVDQLLRLVRGLGVLTPMPEAVRQYLLRYPDLMPALRTACSSTAERFRGRAQVSLEIWRDPEGEEAYPTLYVRQDHYDPGILDEVEAVSLCFEEQLGASGGWLLVTTDFAPPRSR